MAEVRCKRVMFFSRGDEESFFSWAEGVPHVKAVRGVLDEIVLELHAGPVPDESLRELIALLHRYGISMLQLATFETRENSAWFNSPGKFWYSAVFGATHG
ncbi:MAG: hypothetical protein PHX10_06595 [Gallionellaceae bacterium]|nr:hypothetical protein [Gallionellaceae bacterium]